MIVPVTRKEKLLNAIATSGNVDFSPKTREELFLFKILGADLSYSNASSFKTAMDGVLFVYELATPQTYQLTPTEVTALLGDNTIWADTGDVTVTY